MAANENIVDYVKCSLTPIAAEDFMPVGLLILSWVSYFRILPSLSEAATERGVEVRDLPRTEYFPRFFWTM